nr:ankyrin repeat domain-containing protein 13D isoform X2 [Chrysemys picta bellii]
MAQAGDAFPLHLLAWHNRHQALESELRTGQHDIELIDPRGRTPLELAVSLGNLESARVLLRHNANVGRENANGWTVLQEAVSTGDPEMVQLVLQYRDYQRATNRLAGIPELLNKLRKAPDFYVEMKWEFTSWEEGAVVMEVDHDKQVVYTETLSLALHEPELMLAAMQPTEEHVASRLTSPVVSTHLDTKNIAFERNKSGIWGWRSEKMEVISGYEAKVYSASNVELITKTRTEHLSDQDKSRTKGSKTPFQSFLGIAQQHASHNGAPVLQSATLTNPTAITPEEYFDPSFNLEARNIGRPIEMSNKVQRFKATLWLCEDHPLSLVEQVTPIIDLMAISNAHFAKLRDFITLKLPSGFPVKIVFPFPCEVDPVVFEVPQGYAMLGAGRNEPMRDEDDDLLQFAIQQSLLDAGTETDQVTIWEALTNTRPGSNPPSYDEELQLERAIQESMFLQSGQGMAATESGGGGNGDNSIVPPDDSPAPSTNGSSSSALPPPAYPSFDEQLRLAMELSSREQEEQERRRREEDEELQRILQLSLTEK